MSWRWNSSPHPISDIRDWSNAQKLELRPDFQRRAVWNDAAKVMLMDTILQNIPMPKIYLEAKVKADSTFRSVIDGQQRIRAILDFISDQYPLYIPYSGEYENKYFSELPETVRDAFLGYIIDINEIINAPEQIVREIYSRVNKYTVALNKQELRRADFPGDFLNLSESLAALEFFDEARIFTGVARRRMADVEFCSELLAGLISGPQERTDTLDLFYLKYSKWDINDKTIVEKNFTEVLDDVKEIFENERMPIFKTRFRQKADFYCLFLAIHEIKQGGFVLAEKDLTALRNDLVLLDNNIEPESMVSVLQEYAIKCVSQANAVNSRIWRKEFLKQVLLGTYSGELPDEKIRNTYMNILFDLHYDIDCECEPLECDICNRVLEQENFDNMEVDIAWNIKETSYQITNAHFVHKACYDASFAMVIGRSE